jgi:hypothetical protein
MTERLEARLRDQGYTISDCCEFEYYDDENIAADREKELNIKFGYPWSDGQDWRRVKGLSLKKIGENNGRAKLTEQDVIQIRNKYKPRVYTLKMLCEEYNMSRDAMADILHRRNWNYL